MRKNWKVVKDLPPTRLGEAIEKLGMLAYILFVFVVGGAIGFGIVAIGCVLGHFLSMALRGS